MDKLVFFAKNVNELLYQVKTTKDLRIVGGCTLTDSLPQKSISIHSVKELCQISRHERYIDVGPGVTLSALLELGPNRLPPVLYEAILSIGNPIIRNMATIGGNILETNHKMTLFAPLMALDATVEMKNQNDTITIPVQNFHEIPSGFIVTNFRIPLIDGDVAIFRKIGAGKASSLNSASFAFIAHTEKNSITNIRLAFAGPFAFRNKNFETSLIGQRLPLRQNDIQSISETAENLFFNAAQDIMINDVLRQQFINLTRYAFEQLM